MKKTLSIVLAAVMLFVFCSLTACSPFDPQYGDSSDTSSKNIYKNVKIPEIKSDDEKMPTFVDISLYDEENYSDIYLGKKFEFNVTYDGSKMEIPTSLDDMNKKGWKLVENEQYNEESQIMAGKSAKTVFENEFHKRINAVFFNDSKSSELLKDCDIVKLTVPENVYFNKESLYGQFFVNGVSNESAITDVIEYLGAPSHFYAVNENEYYFDYFISPKDKRNGITVYVNLENDAVTAIEISNYD